jgi:hypothetical protein
LEQGLRLGEALYGAECLEEAVSWLGALRDLCEHELKTMGLAEDRLEVAETFQTIWNLHGEAYAELHGREASFMESAEAGKLDARAGANYVLLGESLMLESSSKPAHLRLRTVADEMHHSRELLAAGRRAPGETWKGSALLRQGQIAPAERCFQLAVRADGGHWPAYLGLGLAMETGRLRSASRAESLPELPEPADLAAVVTDWPVLTPLERRVVLASIHPLRSFLSSLAQQRARIVLLPVDVRATDLPELADARDERTDDHRRIEAIGGMADDDIAVARVFDLLLVEGSSAWVFAHEFAHLVLENHRSTLNETVQVLYSRALAVGWLMDFYGAKNDHEFLAVTYQDYLRWRYDLEREKELDEQGVLRDIFDWYDSLGDG